MKNMYKNRNKVYQMLAHIRRGQGIMYSVKGCRYCANTCVSMTDLTMLIGSTCAYWQTRTVIITGKQLKRVSRQEHSYIKCVCMHSDGYTYKVTAEAKTIEGECLVGNANDHLQTDHKDQNLLRQGQGRLNL